MYQSETAPWLWFRAWATDGSAKTDLVYNTSGISIKVARDNQADSSALSLSAASSPTDWAAGKFLQVVGNLYKVGIATASISSYAGAIAICGSYTGGTIEGVLDYVSAYNPTGNPNTTAPATPTNVTDARDAVLARLPATLVSGRMDSTVGAYQTGLAPLQPLVAGRQISVAATTGAVELDPDTQAQIDTIESTVSSIGSQATTVERSTSDTNAITFAWPVSGATITGTRSLNNGAYGAVAGAIAFLRTETGKHYYTLAYNAADRPAAEGQVRYKFVDGTYTGYVVLRTAAAGLSQDVLDQLDDIESSVSTYIAGISAVASTTTGTIVGFPTTLNIGDSYTDEANSSIHVFIRDASDDPITSVGDFLFTDPEFAPEVNITQSGSTGRVKAVVTFVDTSPEDYLKVEIPSSQSRRASPGTATIQCLLKWVDTDGKVLAQKTLTKQAVTWNEMV